MRATCHEVIRQDAGHDAECHAAHDSERKLGCALDNADEQFQDAPSYDPGDRHEEDCLPPRPRGLVLTGARPQTLVLEDVGPVQQAAERSVTSERLEHGTELDAMPGEREKERDDAVHERSEQEPDRDQKGLEREREDQPPAKVALIPRRRVEEQVAPVLEPLRRLLGEQALVDLDLRLLDPGDALGEAVLVTLDEEMAEVAYRCKVFKTVRARLCVEGELACGKSRGVEQKQVPAI